MGSGVPKTKTNILGHIRNQPVDTSKHYVNPDAYVLLGVKLKAIKKDNTPNEDIVMYVKRVILDEFLVEWKYVNSKIRKREYVIPRQLMHYFINKYSTMPLARIGWEIGCRDHATVLHSCRVINNLIDTNKIFSEDIVALSKRIESKVTLSKVDENKESEDIVEENHDTIADWEKVKHNLEDRFRG